MSGEDLYQMMEDPQSLTKDTVDELRHLIEDYPYFQVARMLYLKNLILTNDTSFLPELGNMSIYLPDRKKLFLWLEGEKLGLIMNPQEKPEPEKKDSFSLINAFLSTKEEERKDGQETPLLFQPSVSSDYLSWSLEQTKDTPPTKTPENQLKHHELIDSFLANEQQHALGNGLDTKEENEELHAYDPTKEQPSTLGDSYLTETLARIYIKQKRYEKALQIIKNLNLNYPGKNIYFADQIRFLEKLIINIQK